jgi:hypothetical protein
VRHIEITTAHDRFHLLQSLQVVEEPVLGT